MCLFRYRNGNLGQLSRFSGGNEAEDLTSFVVSTKDYVPSGVHIDAQAIIGSAVLFAVLFVTGFGRISGFNDWVDAWVQRKRDSNRREVMDARVRLQEQWDDADDDDDSRRSL